MWSWYSHCPGLSNAKPHSAPGSIGSSGSNAEYTSCVGWSSEAGQWPSSSTFSNTTVSPARTFTDSGSNPFSVTCTTTSPSSPSWASAPSAKAREAATREQANTHSKTPGRRSVPTKFTMRKAYETGALMTKSGLSAGLPSGPLAHLTHPGPAFERLALLDETGEDHARKRPQGGAPRGFGVTFSLQNQDRDLPSVVAPHLGDAQAGVDGQLVERGAGDVDLEHQVRRRVDREVYAVFTPDSFFVPRVEARIGLETALQILASEGGGAEVFRRDPHLVGDGQHELRDPAVRPLVLGVRAHDLKLPPVVGEARRATVRVLR